MLQIALVGSLLLLTYSLIVGRRRESRQALVVGQVLAVAGPYCMCMMLTPVMVQAALSLCALPLLRDPNGVRNYRRACLAAFLAGWATSGVIALRDTREYDRLRAEYPFRPLGVEQRPPATRPEFQPTVLDAIEVGYEERQHMAERWRGRTWYLRRLHEEHAALFAASAGFGVARMPDLSPTPYRLADPEPLPAGGSSLADMVRSDALEFADPRRWGYHKGDAVAGFLPHALRRQPGPTADWQVERVELLGVLLAPDPRVYLTDGLPRMADLATIPTRHPDGFESPALARLRAGEEIVHDAGEKRLLGAIRAAKQCLSCHGGNRGDLLGAFSYRLR